MIPLSVLDLAPIAQGSDAAQSFRNTLSLAQLAERCGFKRYWLAEHHGMPGIASAATAVLLSHIGSGTSSIRIGAGGIMLPNHSPLVIAEQFGTLESLFPGRIDLGLGRAPGSDQITARALRRGLGLQVRDSEVIHKSASKPYISATTGENRLFYGVRNRIWVLRSPAFGPLGKAFLALQLLFGLLTYLAFHPSRKSLQEIGRALRAGLTTSPC